MVKFIIKNYEMLVLSLVFGMLISMWFSGGNSQKSFTVHDGVSVKIEDNLYHQIFRANAPELINTKAEVEPAVPLEIRASGINVFDDGRMVFVLFAVISGVIVAFLRDIFERRKAKTETQLTA